MLHDVRSAGARLRRGPMCSATIPAIRMTAVTGFCTHSGPKANTPTRARPTAACSHAGRAERASTRVTSFHRQRCRAVKDFKRRTFKGYSSDLAMKKLRIVGDLRDGVHLTR